MPRISFNGYYVSFLQRYLGAVEVITLSSILELNFHVVAQPLVTRDIA
jgi:hypothetical protein